MSTRVDPNLLKELKDYGAVNIESCFNCGNCTAVCGLTSGEANFPRKMIRYAQIGMKDALLGSKELWLCYNCGECSETCPREADPSTFMMAARSYAISSYDFLKIGKILNEFPVIGGFLTVLLGLVLGLFIYAQREPMPSDSLKLFEYIPYEFIHNFGIGVMAFVGLFGLLGIFRMIRQIAKSNNLSFRSFLKGPNRNWLGAMWEAGAVQVLGQQRYRVSCEDESDSPPWYLSKWFIHASTMWGILGLVAATGLDFLLDILSIKHTGAFVPLWYPIRLLGTIAGLFMVYGVTVLIVRRLRNKDKAHSNSRVSDWMFLILLWLCGVTGFAVELSLYLPQALWGYWMLIIHAAISFELMLLVPFTKLAHAIYRTFALYVHALEPVSEGEIAVSPATD